MNGRSLMKPGGHPIPGERATRRGQTTAEEGRGEASRPVENHQPGARKASRREKSPGARRQTRAQRAGARGQRARQQKANPGRTRGRHPASPVAQKEEKQKPSGTRGRGGKPQLALVSSCSILHKDAASWYWFLPKHRGRATAFLTVTVPREVNPDASTTDPIQGFMFPQPICRWPVVAPPAPAPSCWLVAFTTVHPPIPRVPSAGLRVG